MLQKVKGYLVAISCGINWPNVSTINAPGKAVRTITTHSASGKTSGQRSSGKELT